MVERLQEVDSVVLNEVDHPVLLRQPPGPGPQREMLERLGLSDREERVAKDGLGGRAPNLGGGGSSTLVVRLSGADLRVLNTPVHERFLGGGRPVVSAVGMTGGRK